MHLETALYEATFLFSSVTLLTSGIPFFTLSYIAWLVKCELFKSCYILLSICCSLVSDLILAYSGLPQKVILLEVGGEREQKAIEADVSKRRSFLLLSCSCSEIPE